MDVPATEAAIALQLLLFSSEKISDVDIDNLKK
jgi:hypothetical protein